MHFGLFNLMTLPESGTTLSDVISDTMAMVQLADEADFEIGWFAEHHFSNYSVSPSPMMMAAHAAALTNPLETRSAVQDHLPVAETGGNAADHESFPPCGAVSRLFLELPRRSLRSPFAGSLVAQQARR